jgi:hypothetical protein
MRCLSFDGKCLVKKQNLDKYIAAMYSIGGKENSLFGVIGLVAGHQ